MDKSYRNRDVLLLVFGLGAYWPFSLLVGANYSFEMLRGSGSPFAAQIVPYLTSIIAAIALLLGSRVLQQRGKQVLLAFISFCLSLLCSVILSIPGLSDKWLFAAYALGCACATISLVFWGTIASRWSPRGAMMCVSCSLIVGSSIFFILRIVGSPDLSRLSSFLLPLSYILLLLSLNRCTESGKEGRESDKTPSTSYRHPYVVVASLAVCIFVIEIIRTLITATDPQIFSEIGGLTQLSAVLIAVVLCLSARLFRDSFNLSGVSLILVALMILGFASMLIFGSEVTALPVILLGSSYWMLNVFVWVAAVENVHAHGENPVRMFAAMNLFIAGALLFSNVLGQQLSLLFPPGTDITRILAAAIVVVDVASMLVLWDRASGHDALRAKEGHEERGGSTTGDQMSLQSQGVDDAIEAMSEDYRLTAREVDVLRLLVAGRNTPVIQRELTISRGTAQAHIQHIYSKTGVHSRQELIDVYHEYVNK